MSEMETEAGEKDKEEEEEGKGVPYSRVWYAACWPRVKNSIKVRIIGIFAYIETIIFIKGYCK